MNSKSIALIFFFRQKLVSRDGEFEVATVGEGEKEKLAEYVMNKINEKEERYSLSTIRAKEVKISWDGTRVHADDEVVKIPQAVGVL